MTIVQTLLRQVLQMLLLVAVGYFLFTRGKISQKGSKSLGNILIYASLPAVIIRGFILERTPTHTLGLLYSALGAAATLLISILVSRLAFKRDTIAHFASAFSNPGFFGIPLIVAVIGQGSVFYVASYVALLNMLQWTYGVSLMTGQSPRQGISLHRISTAPFMIAIVIGLAIYFTGMQLPELLSGCLSSVAGLNTPLAMFMIGIYLAQTDIKRMFGKRSLYAVSALRLACIPLLCLALLSLLPSHLYELKMALLLASACPVGSNIAVYAQLHDRDYAYAVETVVLSTLLSLISIPLIAWLASTLWLA